MVSSHYHKMITHLKSHPKISKHLQSSYMQCYEETDQNINSKTYGKVINVTCLYKLLDGTCPNSHGFACAEKAHIETEVVESARGYAKDLEEMSELVARALEIVGS